MIHSLHGRCVCSTVLIGGPECSCRFFPFVLLEHSLPSPCSRHPHGRRAIAIASAKTETHAALQPFSSSIASLPALPCTDRTGSRRPLATSSLVEQGRARLHPRLPSRQREAMSGVACDAACRRRGATRA